MFIVLGINHNTAPVDVRERVAFEPASMVEALKDAGGVCGCQGIAILSTCNRTELYFETDKEPEAVLGWLAGWHNVEEVALESVYYLYKDQEAASHLMKVASGLDSLILGEPQILGQLKSAYAVALDAGRRLRGHRDPVEHRCSHREETATLRGGSAPAPLLTSRGRLNR